jgi:hypothetical protein
MLQAASLERAALDDAVTLVAVATLDTMPVARMYAARRALSRLVRQLWGAA